MRAEKVKKEPPLANQTGTEELAYLDSGHSETLREQIERSFKHADTEIDNKIDKAFGVTGALKLSDNDFNIFFKNYKTRDNSNKV